MNFLIAAFVAVWLLITIYLVYIGTRQRGLEEEIAGLEEQMAEKGKIAE